MEETRFGTNILGANGFIIRGKEDMSFVTLAAQNRGIGCYLEIYYPKQDYTKKNNCDKATENSSCMSIFPI